MNQCMCRTGKKGDSVAVSSGDMEGTYKISGRGSLIGSCALDCDVGYWECLIGKEPSGLQMGIKRFLKGDNLNEPLDPANSSVWLLDNGKHPLKEGDVVGIYWDQTALPMLSFSINGELKPELSINRSIFLLYFCMLSALNSLHLTHPFVTKFSSESVQQWMCTLL